MCLAFYYICGVHVTDDAYFYSLLELIPNFLEPEVTLLAEKFGLLMCIKFKEFVPNFYEQFNLS